MKLYAREFEVAEFLRERGGADPAEIAEATGIQQPNVHRILNSLIKKRVVIRQPMYKLSRKSYTKRKVQSGRQVGYDYRSLLKSISVDNIEELPESPTTQTETSPEALGYDDSWD